MHFSPHPSSVLDLVCACIQDGEGCFVLARFLWSKPTCPTVIGESSGLFHVIHWMHVLQLSNVNFELDVMKVVDYYNKAKDDVSEFGTIMNECKQCCHAYLEH
jgi:hypothetical protein